MISLKQSKNKKVENNYKPSKFPQRRCPTYKLKLENPILCKFCEEKIRDTVGRKKRWRSLNMLHAHLSFEHKGLNFRDYLIGLATKIINGELK